jgi:Co/Zn/Cd efflux system component
MSSLNASSTQVQKVVAVVAVINLAYFGVEFAVAQAIDSVSLFADSIDFLEDAAVNFLVLVALSWSVRKRTRVAVLLAALLLVPSVLALWAAWQKLNTPLPPHPLPLSAAGLGALVVNLCCAWLLARVRTHGGSLMRAAYLSARNDAAANVAIVTAGLLTWAYPSVWPDLVVGLAIFVLNANAAREVLQVAARESRAEAQI